VKDKQIIYWDKQVLCELLQLQRNMWEVL